MTYVKKVVFATLLSVLVPGVFAAEEVSSSEGHTVLGHVTTSGKTSIDEVVSELSRKAEEQGAPFFRITFVSGNNRLRGDAVLLK